MTQQNKRKIRGCLWLMMVCAAFMLALAFASPRAPAGIAGPDH